MQCISLCSSICCINWNKLLAGLVILLLGKPSTNSRESLVCCHLLSEVIYKQWVDNLTRPVLSKVSSDSGVGCSSRDLWSAALGSAWLMAEGLSCSFAAWHSPAKMLRTPVREIFLKSLMLFDFSGGKKSPHLVVFFFSCICMMKELPERSNYYYCSALTFHCNCAAEHTWNPWSPATVLAPAYSGDKPLSQRLSEPTCLP